MKYLTLHRLAACLGIIIMGITSTVFADCFENCGKQYIKTMVSCGCTADTHPGGGASITCPKKLRDPNCGAKEADAVQDKCHESCRKNSQI